MSNPATAMQVLIIEIANVIHYIILTTKIDHIRDEIKELRKPYGSRNTVCPYRNEPHYSDEPRPLRHEAEHQDG